MRNRIRKQVRKEVDCEYCLDTGIIGHAGKTGADSAYTTSGRCPCVGKSKTLAFPSLDYMSYLEVGSQEA